MDNIILIGFMGSGKTSVGKLLARKLSYHFIDTDQVIEEKTGKKIREIFAKEGEDYFRQLETEVILQMKNSLKHTVLSVGGGLPIRKGNVEILRDIGTVIFLKTNGDTLKRRLSGDSTRPLISGDEFDNKVITLLNKREPVYEKAAHIIISTDSKSFEDILKEILEKTGEQI